jgi:hypothetical protein
MWLREECGDHFIDAFACGIFDQLSEVRATHLERSSTG